MIDLLERLADARISVTYRYSKQPRFGRPELAGIELNLARAGGLGQRTLEAIRGALETIQGDQRKAARIALRIINADAAQYAELKAARIANIIPVERRDAPLVLTSEPSV